MKKIWYSLAGVVFAFLILGLSMIRYSRQQYFQNNINYEVSVSTNSALINSYDLPYPGILPNHPLYFVKMIRDRVKLILVMDGVEKSRLLLFYADKRIGAAEALLRGNKFKLAEVTAHKAELYMAEAMGVMKSFNEEEKRENIDLWWKYYHSISAHKDLLEEMLLMLEGDVRVSFEKVFRDCEVKRSEIMGELEIEETMVENPKNNEELNEDKGYL